MRLTESLMNSTASHVARTVVFVSQIRGRGTSSCLLRSVERGLLSHYGKYLNLQDVRPQGNALP